MKTKQTAAISLLFLMLLVMKAQAQRYQSYFGVDSTRLNIWEILIDYAPTVYMTINSTDTTNINAHDYLQGYCDFYHDFIGYYDTLFYFREDRESGKLYWYLPNFNKEQLLCDMSLMVGDTFSYSDMWGNHQAVVDRISYENASKVIHFGDTYSIYHGLIFYEGVFPTYIPFTFGGDSYLLCEYKDGEHVFINPQNDTCYIEGLSIQEQGWNQIQVYPTIVQTMEKIHIETSEAISDVALFDLYGREIPIVYTQESSCHWAITIPNCVSGVYLIKASTKKRNSYEKIIVHH